MGDRVDGQNYNDVLLPRGLLPGPLVQLVREPAGFDFDPNGQPHPYLRAFRGVEGSGLETTTANLHWKIDPAEDIQVVLAYDGGDPAITRHAVGRGEVLTMTTAADPDVRWSDLASRPVFVSLIHELLSRSVGDDGGGAGWMNLLAGEPVAVPASVGLGGGGASRCCGWPAGGRCRCGRGGTGGTAAGRSRSRGCTDWRPAGGRSRSP